ncbi:hypothetical protein [Capillimicrobium parvum]|uniref:hypothetical protein n=1 Tax=Capillimicrobium parvum TaxID=2884022 RepID=UPI00216B1330|nr:hypothetical protein [Capillimicrobium parvum]
MNLDRWLDEPLVCTRHRRESRVGEHELWAVAATVQLRDCRILGRLIQARIPGLRSSETFYELFGGKPFNVLDEGPTYRLSGLCGRIWTVRGDFAMLGAPADFLTWDVPGTVRVLFANWAEPTGDGGSALVSEVRIGAVDRRGALRVRALQPFISAFQGLVGAEPLTLAVRRATSR